jgi:hypothetical protein
MNKSILFIISQFEVFQGCTCCFLFLLGIYEFMMLAIYLFYFIEFVLTLVDAASETELCSTAQRINDM